MRRLQLIAGIVQMLLLIFSVTGCQMLLRPLNIYQDAPKVAESSQASVVRVAVSYAALALVDDLEESYQNLYPNTVFEIKATESYLAQTLLDQGQADIAFIISDPGSPVTTRSNPGITPDQPTIIAYDALVIVSSANASIASLTLEQLRDVYAGLVLTWDQVGGDSSRVEFISREVGSVIRKQFDLEVMQGRDISTAAVVLPSDTAVKDYVIRHPGVIGYLSMSYLDARVKAIALNGNQPDALTVKSGVYPLVRPIIALVNQDAPVSARQLLTLATSKQGCAIVARHYVCPR